MKTRDQVRLRNTLVGTSLLFAAIYWLFFACIAQGATYQIQLSVVVTNLSTNADSITVNGSARTWTNAIYTPSTQIRITNSLGWTATNLFNHFATYRAPGPVPIAWSTNTSNAIVFMAAPDAALTFSISGGWGYGTLSTQALTGSYVVRVPVTSENATIRTNIVSGLVAALSNTGATNQITTTAPAFAGYVTKTNGYTTNQVLQNPTLTNGMNYGKAFSSRGATGTASEQFGSNALASADYSMAVGVNSVASNNYATAIGPQAIGGATESVALGYAATAKGATSISIGAGSVADKPYAIAIGGGAESTHTNSVVIGTSVTSTRTNEIRLGGAQDVVIGGLLSVDGTLTNNSIRFTGGTMTNVSGSFSSLLATSLTAHAALLTNAAVEASTITVTSLVAHTAKITNATINAVLINATNLNALAATLTNASGAFSGLTATSLVAHTAKLTNASVEAAVAIVTNLTALSGLVTNTRVDKSFATNLSINGASTLAAGGNIALPATAVTTIADGHNVLDVGSNAYVRLNSNPTATWQLGGLLGDIRDGRDVLVENATGYGMLVLHESGTTPTAGQRISCGSSFLLSSGGVVSFIYDSTASRWKVKTSRDALGQQGLLFVNVGTNYNGTNWAPLTTNIATGYYPIGAFAQLASATSNYLALSGATADYTNIFSASPPIRETTNHVASSAGTLIPDYSGYYLVNASATIWPEVDNNGDEIELEVFLNGVGQEHTETHATLATGVKVGIASTALLYIPAGTVVTVRIRNESDASCNLPVLQLRLNLDSP